MSATAYLDRTTCTSFTFPVPWGFVAGKAWGQPGGHPVLALHGGKLLSVIINHLCHNFYL